MRNEGAGHPPAGWTAVGGGGMQGDLRDAQSWWGTQLVLWGWSRKQVLGEGTRANVQSPGADTSPGFEPLQGCAWRGQWTRAR